MRRLCQRPKHLLGSLSSCRFSSFARKVDQLPIPEVVKQNLTGIGISKLFDIQTKAFDTILRGKSFVGVSKTGSGKTVAYLLPLLERMRHEKMTSPHSLVILVPTRELCKQVGSTLLSLSLHADVALVYGGPSFDSQEQLVRLGATIVIATPGRCAQLIHRGAIDTKNVRALVIDEADAMYGPEFVGRVERVVNAVAKQGLQKVLFSASLPPDVLALIRHFADHEYVDLVNRHGKMGDAVVQSVDHRLCKVDDRRLAARVRVLLHILSERLDLSGRCIIFADTAHEARTLLSHPALGHRAQAVHSESSIQERDRILTAFANLEFDVLITTDVLSRGIDFADVKLVMQLHPPKEAVQYIHRSGRTGRAGQGGTCITFYDASERKLLQRVRAVTNHDFAMLPLPGPLDIHNASVSRLLEQIFSVQPEEYDQVMEDASKLLEMDGPQVLSTAMAILDSRHADLQRAVCDRPSILSGKKGYLCLLANDPDHTVATTEGEVQRIVGSLLPKTAVIGRVARVTGGWALDVQHHHASRLVEELRSGRQSAPFEVVVCQRMPRVLRASRSRRAKAPWTAQRRWAFRRSAKKKEKNLQKKMESVLHALIRSHSLNAKNFCDKNSLSLSCDPTNNEKWRLKIHSCTVDIWAIPVVRSLLRFRSWIIPFKATEAAIAVAEDSAVIWEFEVQSFCWPSIRTCWEKLQKINGSFLVPFIGGSGR